MNIYTAIQSRKRGAILKHSHFYELYARHFEMLQDEEIRLLEIGVFNAGSLYMWKQFFNNAENLVGIDIDPYCKRWEDESEKVFVEIGDQTNDEFLKAVNEIHGSFDIIIDDGGHENNQIITSFKTLFPLLNDNGIYVIEDTYHSYWPDYDCDRDKSTAFKDSKGIMKGDKPIDIDKTKSDITAMNFLKSLIDKMNVAAYIEGSKESSDSGCNKKMSPPDYYEKSIFAMSFYDNICFIQKKMRSGYDSFGKSEWISHNNTIPDDDSYE